MAVSEPTDAGDTVVKFTASLFDFVLDDFLEEHEDSFRQNVADCVGIIDLADVEFELEDSDKGMLIFCTLHNLGTLEKNQRAVRTLQDAANMGDLLTPDQFGVCSVFDLEVRLGFCACALWSCVHVRTHLCAARIWQAVSGTAAPPPPSSAPPPAPAAAKGPEKAVSAASVEAAAAAAAAAAAKNIENPQRAVASKGTRVTFTLSLYDFVLDAFLEEHEDSFRENVANCVGITDLADVEFELDDGDEGMLIFCTLHNISALGGADALVAKLQEAVDAGEIFAVDEFGTCAMSDVELFGGGGGDQKQSKEQGKTQVAVTVPAAVSKAASAAAPGAALVGPAVTFTVSLLDFERSDFSAEHDEVFKQSVADCLGVGLSSTKLSFDDSSGEGLLVLATVMGFATDADAARAAKTLSGAADAADLFEVDDLGEHHVSAFAAVPGIAQSGKADGAEEDEAEAKAKKEAAEAKAGAEAKAKEEAAKTSNLPPGPRPAMGAGGRGPPPNRFIDAAGAAPAAPAAPKQTAAERAAAAAAAAAKRKKEKKKGKKGKEGAEGDGEDPFSAIFAAAETEAGSARDGSDAGSDAGSPSIASTANDFVSVIQEEAAAKSAADKPSPLPGLARPLSTAPSRAEAGPPPEEVVGKGSIRVVVTVLRQNRTLAVGAEPGETAHDFKMRVLAAIGLRPSAPAKLIYAGHGKQIAGLKTLAQFGIAHRTGLQLELLSPNWEPGGDQDGDGGRRLATDLDGVPGSPARTEDASMSFNGLSPAAHLRIDRSDSDDDGDDFSELPSTTDGGGGGGGDAAHGRSTGREGALRAQSAPRPSADGFDSDEEGGSRRGAAQGLAQSLPRPDTTAKGAEEEKKKSKGLFGRMAASTKLAVGLKKKGK